MSMTELRDTTLPNRVLKVLRHGQDNAITSREIVSRLGYKKAHDRQVRLAILDLIDQGYPVASSVNGDKGYFLVSTWQEAEEYRASLKARLINIAIRMRDFRNAARNHLSGSRQLSLM